MISETKLDNSFPDGQFLVEGYSKPYRIDRNCHGCGMLCKNRYSINNFDNRTVNIGTFLCRDQPTGKEMVVMLLLQRK